jgi:hypothetical protein
MILSSRSVPLQVALLGLIIILAGCSKKEETSAPPKQGPSINPPAPPGGMSSSETGKLMSKIGRGLNMALRTDLEADPTPWDKIQPKTKEYAQLASELGKHDPPKGDKESWKKSTSAFAGDAAALDSAAQAKKLDDAKAAYSKLNNACNACHNEHRMGPGRGGPGGRRGKGGPKGPPQG